MDTAQPHDEFVEEPQDDGNGGNDDNEYTEENHSNRLKLRYLSIGTTVATVLIVFNVVVVSTVIREAILLGGYLNSIPRVVERREAYLSGTDEFYSRDYSVRGEIAAMLYDNTTSDDVLKRVEMARDEVGAVGIVLVDEDGNVIVDTEAAATEAKDAQQPAGTPAGGGEASQEDAPTPDDGTTAGVAADNIEQIISSENDLIIINEDTNTSDATLTISVPTGQADDGGQEGDADQSEDAAEGQDEEARVDEAKGDEAKEDKEDKEAADVASDKYGSTDDDPEGSDGADGAGEDGAAAGGLIDWTSIVGLNEDEEEDGEDDGDGGEQASTSPSTYVFYRAKSQDGSTLIIKFDPTTTVNIYQEEGQWEKLLNRLVTGIDAYAFVREDATGTWTGYPLTSITKSDLESLEKELAEVDDKVAFKIPLAAQKGLSGVRFGIMSLNGTPYLVELRTLSDKGLTFVMAIPFSRFFQGPMRSGIMIIIFIALSIFLLAHYIRVCLAGMPDEHDVEKLIKRVRSQCRAGIIVVIVVLGLVALMTIMLSKSAMTATTARTQRESLTYELDHQEQVLEQVFKEYDETSVTQATAMARLLSEQPQLRTRAGLRRLADIVDARYLMLFDKEGRELYSSNSYIGFRIERDDSLSVETILDAPGLQSLLLGESCVISDSIEDRQGNSYHLIGALLTDDEGLPAGFLVMAVDEPEIDAVYEEDLNPLMNHQGQVAMVVDDETGAILKHSDVSRVGDPVSAYLSEDVLGRSYEGYTWYEKRYVYMSSDTHEGISTIVLSTNTMGIEDVFFVAALVFVHAILLGIFYYPLAVRLCCTSKRKLKATSLGNPLSVFLYGYSVFFCVLSLVAYYSSSRGNWPAFNAVFEGKWSKGINQFSMWSAIFFTTQAMTALYVVKRLLKRMADNSLTNSRTIIRLCDSLLSYVVVIAVALVDMTWFGVDTTTLIASAGIVSIAVGMGAKDLIADILAGMFIIFESSVHVGDIVKIGDWRGTVTDMGIRTCEITDRNNNVKVVNNSHISELVNFSRKMTSSTLEFEIERDVSVEDVPKVVEGYIDALVEEVPDVANSLHFVGITSITDDSYKVTLGWSCDESKREALTFRLNNAVRLVFERAERRKREQAEAAEHGEHRHEHSS